MAKENKFAKIASAVKKDEKNTVVKYDVLIKIPEDLNTVLHFLYKKAGYKSKQEMLYNLAKKSMLKDHKDLLAEFNLEL